MTPEVPPKLMKFIYQVASTMHIAFAYINICCTCKFYEESSVQSSSNMYR